jgi:hypothetical protein
MFGQASDQVHRNLFKGERSFICSDSVTGSRNEASLYASWTGVSSGTGQYEFVW